MVYILWSNLHKPFCTGIEDGSGYATGSVTLLGFIIKPPKLKIHAFSISVPTEVFTVQFWMALLGAATCKRTKMMGNIPTINGLDLGRLSKETRQEKLKNKTTRPSARLDHDNRVRCVLSSCFVQSSWLLVSEASISTAME